jgi:hypothetical protein
MSDWNHIDDAIEVGVGVCGGSVVKHCCGVVFEEGESVSSVAVIIDDESRGSEFSGGRDADTVREFDTGSETAPGNAEDGSVIALNRIGQSLYPIVELSP